MTSQTWPTSNIESNLSHLDNLLYALCDHFDEKNKNKNKKEKQKQKKKTKKTEVSFTRGMVRESRLRKLKIIL